LRIRGKELARFDFVDLAEPLWAWSSFRLFKRISVEIKELLEVFFFRWITRIRIRI
jgi:hypothetical protein